MNNKRLLRIAVASVMALSVVGVSTVLPVTQTLTVSAASDYLVFNLKSLNNAIASSSSSNPANIKLASDITGSISVASGKYVTIDLNGHSITGSDNSPVITNNGNLTIKGTGTVTKSSNVNTYVVDNSGTMTIDGGTFTNTSKSSSLVRNNGTMTINDGTFTNNWIAIKNDDYGTININGGTITSKVDGATAFQNWGTATISGGTFNATEKSFAVTVNTWTKAVKSTLEITSDSTSVINGDVQVSQYTYISDSANLSKDNINNVPTMVINGGAIEGSIISGSVQDDDINGNELKNSIYQVGEVIINGGSVDGSVAIPENKPEYVSVTGSTNDKPEVSQLEVVSGEFTESPLNFIADASLGIALGSKDSTKYIIGSNKDIFAYISNEGVTADTSIGVIKTSNDTKETLDLSSISGTEDIVITNETTEPVLVIMPDITLFYGHSRTFELIDSKIVSNDISIVVANNNGTIKPISMGTTYITITTNDGLLAQRYNVTVKDDLPLHLLELKKQVLGVIPKDVENYDFNEDNQVNILDVIALKGQILY